MLKKDQLRGAKGFAGAIFDLDGTLIDSMPVWREIDRQFFEDRGMEFDPAFCDIVAPMGVPESARYVISAYGLTDTPEEIAAIWHKMAIKEYRTSVEMKPGALSYLRLLRENNIPMAIATASARELVMPAIERLGLLPYFEAIVTTEDVGKPKGYPDICLYAAEKLGVPPEECVMFEDAFPGMQSAKMAGMRVCALYDASADAEREKIRALTDLELSSFEELVPLPV